MDPIDALLDPPPNGECDICHRDGGARGLFLDHNHETGRIRGWLCNGCNLAIGYLADDPAIASSAAEYLSRPPLPPRPQDVGNPVGNAS